MNLNKDGTKNDYIFESYRTDSGKSTTRIVRKLGSHDELLKERSDPKAWAQSVVEEMNREAQGGKQQIMVPYRPQKQIAIEAHISLTAGSCFCKSCSTSSVWTMFARKSLAGMIFHIT